MDFVSRVGEALAEAGRRGIRVTVGAGADMKLPQPGRRAPEEPHPTGRPHLLETPPGPRDPGAADGTSRLCYFLDGVQSSREIGRIGAAPVVVATVAAAIANRCDRKFKRVELEGLPVVARAVILPRRAGEEVEEFWRLLLGAGLVELGPDDAPSHSDLLLDSTAFVDEAEFDPFDYVGMLERGRVRVRAVRERLEGELLRRWEGDLGLGDDWIAVDGQLRDIRESNRRAIGLIKSVARPEFVGQEVRMLLDLEPGMRTTSFVPAWQTSRDLSERRTSWYLRSWPTQRGADALGSLMRIEAPRDITPDEVDEITRWVLAERAPLAKPDPRWPAMIYPIYHVEKMLKPVVQGSERAYARLERHLVSAAPANANGR